MGSEYLAFFVAIQHEVYRVNQAIHRGLRPILYRQKEGYIIYGVEYECGYLWYDALLLIVSDFHIHVRVPYVKGTTIQGCIDSEWEALLRESFLERHEYFKGMQVVTGNLVDQDTLVDMQAIHLQETTPLKKLR